MLSHIMVHGNFVSDPESRATQDGKNIAIFSLACNGRGNEASFYRCVAFGTTAEFIIKNFEKGKECFVAGRPQQKKFTGDDGVVRSVFEIIVNEIDFAGRKTATTTEGKAETRSQKEEEFGDEPF